MPANSYSRRNLLSQNDFYSLNNKKGYIRHHIKALITIKFEAILLVIINGKCAFEFFHTRFFSNVRYLWNFRTCSTPTPEFIMMIKFPFCVTISTYICILTTRINFHIHCPSMLYVHLLLIHSADPQSPPLGIIVFSHVVRQFVTFQNLAKQNKVKTMFATGEIVGLAKWIIDDTCLVFAASPRHNEP